MSVVFESRHFVLVVASLIGVLLQALKDCRANAFFCRVLRAARMMDAPVKRCDVLASVDNRRLPGHMAAGDVPPVFGDVVAEKNLWISHA